MLAPASRQRAEVLAKMLRSDSSASVRRIAAWGLHNYGDVRVAVDALIAAVTGDADTDVREMAAWSLAEAERQFGRRWRRWRRRCARTRTLRCATTATWALGSVGDASAVDALGAVLSDQQRGDTRGGRVGDRELRAVQGAGRVGECPGRRERDVRLSAAWALYNIDDEDAGAAIEAAYKRETDPEVRVGLIRALGAMGDRAVDALQRLVTSSDPQVRAIAVTALAGGGASGPWPWPRPEPGRFLTKATRVAAGRCVSDSRSAGARALSAEISP